jgi:hypothetical protein
VHVYVELKVFKQSFQHCLHCLTLSEVPFHYTGTGTGTAKYGTGTGTLQYYKIKKVPVLAVFRIRIRIGAAFDGLRIRIPNVDPDPGGLKRAKRKGKKTDKLA